MTAGALPQAAARAGDRVTSAVMAAGQPFDELAHQAFSNVEEATLEEARDAATPLAALIASLPEK